MKKMTMTLLAALLIFAVAGHAWADFENQYTLTQTIYNENDIEIGVDLGLTNSIDWSATNLELAPSGTVPWGEFNVGVEDLRVGYFAGENEIYHPWFATIKETLPENSESQTSAFLSGNASVRGLYKNNIIAPNVAKVTPNTINAYDFAMNCASQVPGYYAAYNKDFVDGEAVLGDLATAGYVDMYLYHWDIITPDPGPDATTDYTGVLRLYADGSTVLNPTVVPIPGAAILLGSGLLGLVGIRRRNT